MELTNMQTFLPFESFIASAATLDRRRLGKQRVECKQILLACTNPDYGWQNHPAVRMWRGHERVLCEYGIIVCQEWRMRGYNDSLLEWFDAQDRHLALYGYSKVEPLWNSDQAFHLSHQSNLVRKDPVHYRQYFPDVPADLPYVWPLERCGSINDKHSVDALGEYKPKAPIAFVTPEPKPARKVLKLSGEMRVIECQSDGNSASGMSSTPTYSDTAWEAKIRDQQANGD